MAGIRCKNTCRKFTGNEIEIEIQEPEVDGDEVTFTADIVVNCADCGEPKVEGTAEYRETVHHDCGDTEKNDENVTDGYDFDVAVSVASTYKNKNGVGAMLDMTITCNRCGADIAPPALHVETDDLQDA